MNANFQDNAGYEPDEERKSPIDFKDFLADCIGRWWWFVISLVVCLSVAAFYVLRTTPVYERSALVQVRDDKHGAPMNNAFANAFTDLSMFSTSADIFNEIVAIRSPRLLRQVVDNLDLNVDYTTKKGLRRVPLYNHSNPFTVTFIDRDKIPGELVLNTPGDDSTEGFIDGFQEFIGGKFVKYPDRIAFHTDRVDTLKTPIGLVAIRPNASFTGKPLRGEHIKVTYVSPKAAAAALGARFMSSLAEEHATVIKLEITDSSPERAEDILNNLIEVYNKSWVDDRNIMARETSRFINDRLVNLEGELSDVDTDISSYKSTNLLPDVEASSALYLEQAAKTGEEITALNNSLAMARYVKDYLSNPANAHTMLPANSSIGAPAVDQQIIEYNRMMVNRNTLAASSNENNPRVMQYDQSLAEMQQAIISAVETQIAGIKASIEGLRRSEARATAHIAANPQQAKYLMTIGRQQKVKEALYLYLLQKREENELNQTFAPYNTRILQDASGANTPIAPMPMLIMAFAGILGLVLPAGVIYGFKMFDTTVRSRRDLDNLSVPFLGEIPLLPAKKRKDATAANEDQASLVVEHGRNDSINEAFRLLRSSLEFMIRTTPGKSSVIMVTSAIPGSGKTFITLNLAATIALKGKRVAVVDLDLRRCTLSKNLNLGGAPGVSNYLTDAATLDKIIRHDVDGHKGLDFIPSGPTPPNPAELLGGDRLGELFASLRQQYDVILIDCPPSQAVEDARAITVHTDMTLYIVRVGRLDRAFIPEIERMSREQIFSRMAIVMNGAKATGAYGTRYGYNYGYGYGTGK